MTLHEQGSAAWHAERAGKITASVLNDIVLETEDGAVFKSGPRKGQAKPLPAYYLGAIRRIAAERITGRSRDQIKAPQLQWGHDVEPVARAAYEARTGLLVERCGFVVHPTYPYIGASPDFLVGAAGGGEIKCPESIEVHMGTLEDGLPEEHVNQIQGNLFVLGRSWWDFVSFHPAYPAPLNLYVQRVQRDDAYIALVERRCIDAEAKVREIIARHLPQLQAAA
jgi:predicted phage-related endonuclease